MAPLKFRCWHKTQKLMVEFGNFGVCDEYSHLAFPATDRKYQGICALPQHFEDEKELVVMQWTGLKDRDGREIFEGDIIEMEWSKSDKGLYPVEWRDGGFEFYPAARFNPDGDELDIARVVGNIHENPDLLPSA